LFHPCVKLFPAAKILCMPRCPASSPENDVGKGLSGSEQATASAVKNVNARRNAGMGEVIFIVIFTPPPSFGRSASLENIWNIRKK
jgi:hypothetical protein